MSPWFGDLLGDPGVGHDGPSCLFKVGAGVVMRCCSFICSDAYTCTWERGAAFSQDENRACFLFFGCQDTG